MQAQPGRVRQQLIAEGVELEEVGGEVQCVETAATKGQGLLELEEALLLQVFCPASKLYMSRGEPGLLPLIGPGIPARCLLLCQIVMCSWGCVQQATSCSMDACDITAA